MNSCSGVYSPLYILQEKESKNKIGGSTPPLHDVQFQTRERQAFHILGTVMGIEKLAGILLLESSQTFYRNDCNIIDDSPKCLICMYHDHQDLTLE